MIEDLNIFILKVVTIQTKKKVYFFANQTLQTIHQQECEQQS